MSLRFVEIFLPIEHKADLFSVLEAYPSAEVVQKEHSSEQQFHVKVLMKAEDTEQLLDQLEKKFSPVELFRIVMVPVAAAIPRAEPDPEEEKADTRPSQQRLLPARISREELYAKIHEASRLTSLFVLLVILSSIVAAIGLLRDHTAVVIGAMVIAPLLGPNVALSLAATMGDVDLARQARRANLAGIFVPFVLSAGIGFAVGLFSDGASLFASTGEIYSRTQVEFSDIVLATAAGCTAALSFTTALSTTLIGVMVAVAMLPPLVACGLLAGAGCWRMAVGAGLLFLANLISVNLAGVVTFLVQGVQPLWYWDQNKARSAVRRALVIWACLLLLLIGVIFAARIYGS
jgi:uncharacterized hydrophobic protein (TIGR00341 family)